jgi:hypothetical protein
MYHVPTVCCNGVGVYIGLTDWALVDRIFNEESYFYQDEFIQCQCDHDNYVSLLWSCYAGDDGIDCST